jgi:hypothetical protein
MSMHIDDPSDLSARQRRRPLLPRSVSARRGGIAVACVLAAIGLVFLVQAAKLDFGGVDLPGAGFFPSLMGAALIVLGSGIGFQLLRGSADDGTLDFGHRDVLIVFAALLAVPLLFEPLGAYATLGVFGAVLLVLLARTSVVLAVAAATVAMAACWFFFQVLLGLLLPTGPW